MTLTEEVFAQASALAGDLDDRQTELLKVLCAASAAELSGQLREGLTAEDCRADFVAAAGLLAAAALEEAGQTGGVEEFRAGDLTVKRGGADAVSRCLRRQAQALLLPYRGDPFAFRGV